MKNLSMRSRAIRFLSIAAASIGALVLFAAPALAVNTSYLYFTNGASPQGVLCQAGTTGNVEYPYYITKVQNNCEFRMWLHQYRDGTGYNTCISPHTSKGIPSLYRQWQVTSNTSSC